LILIERLDGNCSMLIGVLEVPVTELKIDSGAWVVVCDGAKALVLENAGNRKTPKLKTKEVYQQDDPKTHEIGTDKPGRASSSVGSGRSAIEQTDWHDQEEQRFLGRLAARLDQAVLGGETPSLIVVAPPRAIGVLRRAYSSHVRQAIRAEVEKDYVKMPLDEITRHLVQ
jgi:protein required for attachment to host cells